MNIRTLTAVIAPLCRHRAERPLLRSTSDKQNRGHDALAVNGKLSMHVLCLRAACRGAIMQESCYIDHILTQTHSVFSNVLQQPDRIVIIAT